MLWQHEEVLPVLTQYTLFDNYAYLHDNAHKNTGELIFQINYLVGVRENAIPQLTLPFNLQVGAYGDHLGAMIPTNEFVASYEAGDLRTQERQFYFSAATLRIKTRVPSYNLASMRFTSISM
jgi:hypothetical protein